MSVPLSNSRLRVPPGFQALLEGFTREVLRNQPADIYAFGALYFEEMLRRRDETGEADPAQLALRLQDRMLNGGGFVGGPTADPSNPQHQQASVVIQADYRRRAAQREADKLRKDRAAGDIQAAVRGHQERASGPRTAGLDDASDEVDIDLDDPEVAAAAAKIQAGFKGYKTRKQMRKTAPAAAQPSETDVDIDLNDPEVAAAAEKIQAGFKGYKTRKQMKQQSSAAVSTKKPPEDEVDIDLNDPEVAAAAEKIQAGFKGYKTRKQMKQQPQRQNQKAVDAEVDIDLNDPEVAAAAEKIQAGFKGYKTRKEMKQQPRKSSDSAAAKPMETDVDIDIDLNDPEVAAAAEKIQAGFKGYKTRKQMQVKKTTNDNSGKTEEVDIDLNDPEVAAAAEKIQAGFKGYKTRKQMQQKGPQPGSDQQE